MGPWPLPFNAESSATTNMKTFAANLVSQIPSMLLHLGGEALGVQMLQDQL